MRFYFLLLTLLTFFSCSEKRPPNVVFIMADDLGWKDVGFLGSTIYQTPNLDRLRRQSMLFTNAYAAASNCAPSRATLMTGQYAPHHNIYTVASSERGRAETRRIIPTPNTDTLAPNFQTLGHLFQQQGYVTGTFGKWHLGTDPRQQGFDVNVGGSRNGSPNGTYFSPYNLRYLENGPEGEYLTDRLTDEAMAFVEEHQEQPFFLYLPYHSVHTPIQAREEVIAKYRNQSGIRDEQHATYAAMIEILDSNVGRLLEQLETLDLMDNTIIVCTSDNGGIHAISNQDPLRAGKGSYYEGGTRVPLLVRWDSKVAPNSTSDTPTMNIDFYPTFAEILNAEKGDLPMLEGESLLPVLLQNDTLAERPLFWHFPIYLQAYKIEGAQSRDPIFRTRPGSTMRLGKWKLHEYFEDGALELYDLENDMSETVNLVDSLPEKATELHQILKDWRQQNNAPVPTEKNPAFDAAVEADILEGIGK